MRTQGLALALAVPLLLGGTSHAHPLHPAAQTETASPEGTLEEARALLLEGLRKHASWLRGQKLFLERKGVLEAILALEPDDAEARRALGWKSDRNGGWAPPAKPKKLRNYSASALREAPERYAQALAPGLEALRRLDAGSSLDPDERTRLEQLILVVCPTDPVLRARRGEVAAGDAWVLEETAASAGQRTRIAGLVTHALTSLDPPREEPAGPHVRALSELERVFATPEGVVFGTVAAEELDRVARLLRAAPELFRGLCDPDASLPGRLTVAVLASPAEAGGYLAHQPRIAEADRAALAKTAGTWVPGTSDIAYWTDDAAARADGICRLLVSNLLARSYGLGLQRPWLHEGFGLVLTEALVGTRRTWFLPCYDAGGGDAFRARLLENPAWKRAALDLLDAAEGPLLPGLFHATQEEFTSEDLALAYAFTAFLLEAHPAEVHGILERLGAGAKEGDVLSRALGRDLGAIEARFHRWLRECEALEQGELVLPTTPAAIEASAGKGD